MRLGYHTNGLVHHRIEDALRLLFEEGFEVAALTPDVGHLDPFHLDPVQVARIRGLREELGLSCVIETGARFLLDRRRKHRPNLLEEDLAERNLRLDYLKRCLALGAELGAETLSFWSGVLPAGTSEAQARDRLRQGVEALLAEAGPLGLALEPEPGMWIETVDRALGFLGDLGDPEGLGLTLDIGHLWVTGEGRPSDIVPRTAGRLRQVHVEDMRPGIHAHLPPGEGVVDFPEVWASLEGIQYDGPVCFELSRSSHEAPEILEKVRKCFMARRDS